MSAIQIFFERYHKGSMASREQRAVTSRSHNSLSVLFGTVGNPRYLRTRCAYVSLSAGGQNRHTTLRTIIDGRIFFVGNDFTRQNNVTDSRVILAVQTGNRYGHDANFGFENNFYVL